MLNERLTEFDLMKYKISQIGGKNLLNYIYFKATIRL